MGRARVGVVVTGVRRARVRAVTGRVVASAAVVGRAVVGAMVVAVAGTGKRAPSAPVSASSPS